MERLTNADHIEIGFCSYTGAKNPYIIPLTIGELCSFPTEKYSPREILEEVFARLAAYEDTGLEPVEVKDLKDGICSGCSVPQLSDEHRHIQDLLQAEKDGRLVVLPVNPYLKPTQQNEMYICENGEVWAIYVTGCEAGPNADGVFTVMYTTVDGDVFSADDIGKTVFLTHQEAEAALRKERK